MRASRGTSSKSASRLTDHLQGLPIALAPVCGFQVDDPQPPRALHAWCARRLPCGARLERQVQTPTVQLAYVLRGEVADAQGPIALR